MHHDDVQFWLTVWGAALATMLGAIKLWEVWKDRLRLATTYSFTGQEGAPDQITIINLGPLPYSSGTGH
jgi:hypothetical protein